MREVITVTGKNWTQEEQKISLLIKERQNQISQKNPSMVLTEAYLQAIVQLMEEEKIPLLILPN